MKFSLTAIEESGKTPFRLVIGKDADGTEAGFMCMGVGSDEYEESERQIQILNIQEAATRKKILDMAEAADAAMVHDGADIRRAVTLKHCVIDWFGFTTDDGAPAPFNHESLMRVLKRRPRWQDRILAELEQERDFTVG